MKKRIPALLLALLCCLPLPVHAVELPVEAKAALLMEKETGQVLFAKEEHQRLEPASAVSYTHLTLPTIPWV